MNYTDKQIEWLLQGIFSGRIGVESLPENLYMAIAEYLEGGLYKGYGKTILEIEFGTTRYKTLVDMRTNIYLFSAAKTYQQVYEMEGFRKGAESFDAFRTNAAETFKRYNESYLEAEYNTVVGQAQIADLWNGIQEDKLLFPYLRYSTVIDGRESPQCRLLNNLVARVDDPIWRKYAPLNHYNCRCVLDKIDRYDPVVLTHPDIVKETRKELSKMVAPEFQMNAGRDAKAFSDKHPYFDVAKKNIDLAKRNFDLPIPPPPKK